MKKEENEHGKSKYWNFLILNTDCDSKVNHKHDDELKSDQKVDEFTANTADNKPITPTKTVNASQPVGQSVESETKLKRKRKLKTTEQRKYLRYYYDNESQFPTKNERHQISGDLRISFSEVSQWFHNQRAAERKKAREEEGILTMVSIQSWENIYRGDSSGRHNKKKK